MFNLISFAWGYIISKFIIWPRRLEGMIWIPILSATNWYRITDMIGKCPYYLLPFMYVYENTITLFIFTFMPKDTVLFTSITIAHIINNIWWPGFIEIKYSFFTCFLLSIVNITLYIFLCMWIVFKYRYPIIFMFIVLLKLTTCWHCWISYYTCFVVKEPITFIAYQERQARKTINV